jgi:spermidine synthase
LRADSADPRPAIGRLTSANTLGGALGAALAGLVLLPRLGMETSLFVLAAGYALLTLLFVEPRSGRRSWLPAAAAAGAVAFFPFGLMQSHLSQASQVFRALDGSTVARVTEGPVTTLQVLRSERFGESLVWRLVTDSYSMSGTHRSSLRYMQLFAWLPLALHPAPRRALLISYGAGNTAQALLDEPSLLQLTIVDTSPEILDASRLLHADRDPLRDPRVRLVLEDGRHYLLSQDEPFDIITGEPPPPDIAGVVNLYTSEYFAALARRLVPGGLATYWLPVNQFEPRGARAVIAAWCAAFPDCSLWAGSTYNWVLLGGRGFANRPDLAHFARLWENPAAAPRVAASGFEHPAQLGATFLADAGQLHAWIDGTPMLTDDYPKRIAAPPPPRQSLEEYSRWLKPEGASRRFTTSRWIERHWPQSLREQSLQFFSVQPIVNGQVGGEPAKQLPLVDWLLRSTQLQVPVYWLLGSDIAEQRILEKLPHQREHAYARGVRALAERDYARAVPYFVEAGDRALAEYATCRAASAQSPC